MNSQYLAQIGLLLGGGFPLNYTSLNAKDMAKLGHSKFIE
jgi:hypothetical protein